MMKSYKSLVIVLVLYSFLVFGLADAKAEMVTVFSDDYDAVWDATPVPSGPLGDYIGVPNVSGGVARGIGSGYSNPLYTWMVIPLAFTSNELEVTLRGESGPSWPNQAAIYLMDTSWGGHGQQGIGYGFGIYGESANYRFVIYKNQFGSGELASYSIGSPIADWHTYVVSRDAVGNWALTMDGITQSASFMTPDLSYTDFTHIGTFLYRNQSALDYVEVKVPCEPACVVDVGHWNFDEGASNIISDSSPTGNHGTISNSLMWTTPGYDGTGFSLSFGGYSNPVEATVPHDTSLDFNGYIALSAWVKPVDTGQSILPVIVKGGGTGSNSVPYALYLYDNQVTFLGNYQTGGTGFLVKSGATVEYNEWSHIKAVYNMENVSLYIEDETTSDWQLVHQEAVNHAIINNSSPLAFGIDYPGFTERYGGLIDEVVVEVKVPCETVIEVAIDIKPGSCPNPLRVNFQGKGVLLVAILGSEEFNVRDIDITTITLEGVYPIRSSFEDVSTPFDGEECECSTDGPDGIFDDLVLKFDRQEILTALEATYGDLTVIPNRTELPLTLTAKLMNEGPELEGTDCLTILNRGAIKRKK